MRDNRSNIFPSTFMFRVSFPPVPEIFAVWLDFHFSDPLGPPEHRGFYFGFYFGCFLFFVWFCWLYMSPNINITSIFTCFSAPPCHQTSIFTCFDAPPCHQTSIFTCFDAPPCHQTSIFTYFNAPPCHQTSIFTYFNDLLGTSWGLPGNLLGTSWGPLGDLGTSWELLGDLLANLECSGRPAFRSSNKKVNQLKIDLIDRQASRFIPP